MEWYFASFRRYRDFWRGRARRTEFWTYMLCSLVLGLTLSTVQALISHDIVRAVTTFIADDTADATKLSVLLEASGLLLAFGVTLLIALVTILPTHGVAVRRLHDTGRSGWWLLITLIPLFGVIALLVMLCQDSEASENEFGLNPKAHPATAERRHVAAMGDYGRVP
jgi:uncharacterized membrane protein YhaH (DUF805 family)